jgi:hypothetical protein
MPRTIESIVDCHRAARRLQAAGKPVWRMEIPVREIIQRADSTSHEGMSKMGRDMAKAFRTALPSATFDITSDDYDREIDEIIEDIESHSAQGLASLESEGVDVKDMFNGRLDEIYDWADRERIWLGA